MRTAAMGPRKGISEMLRAADAPTKAHMSAGNSGSYDSTVAVTWVSSL